MSFEVKNLIQENLSEWELLCCFLPDGWREQAKACHALERAREIPDPDTLLRILLIHLANGCSLRETAVRAREAGWARLSDVAVMKRLRQAEEWLRWLAEHLGTGARPMGPDLARRVVIVDATTVSEPGSTGTDWRIHYALNLHDCQCRYFELTDGRGGETWRRFPVPAGAVLMGDRIYANPPGVAHVARNRGEVLVRLNRHALPLYAARETEMRLEPLRRVRGLRLGHIGDWPAWVKGPGGVWIEGRLLALKRSRAATRKEIKRLEKIAQRNHHPVTRASRRAAGYVLLWTTLGPEYPARPLLELYRARWQIELAFKRLKSILGLGHLPKKDPQAARAWLHGKLVVALLIERILDTADSISPWGYPLQKAPEPVVRNGVLAS